MKTFHLLLALLFLFFISHVLSSFSKHREPTPGAIIKYILTKKEEAMPQAPDFFSKSVSISEAIEHRIECNDLPGAAFVAICERDIVSRNALCSYLLKDHDVHVPAASDVELVYFLLRQMDNVEHCDQYGNTLLHSAVQTGRLDIVDVLLRLGADANKENELGETPFAKAIMSGHVDVLLRLLDKMHNLDKKDKFDNTYLHLAAQFDRLEIAKIILPRMSDINFRNKWRLTPLDLAIKFKHGDVANLILDEIHNLSQKLH